MISPSASAVCCISEMTERKWSRCSLETGLAFTHVLAAFGSVAAHLRMTLSITLFRISPFPIDRASESDSPGLPLRGSQRQQVLRRDCRLSTSRSSVKPPANWFQPNYSQSCSRGSSVRRQEAWQATSLQMKGPSQPIKEPTSFRLQHAELRQACD